MTTLVALLLTGAVLAWPFRRGRPPLRFGLASASSDAVRGEPGRAAGPGDQDLSHRRPGHHGRSVAAAWLLTVLGARHRRAAVREAEEEVVLQLVAVMVPALRSGLPPSRALQLAGEVLDDTAATRQGPRRRAAHSVTVEARQRLDRMVGAASEGDPLGPHWQRWARASGAPGLAVLSRAWSLSERTGAPLADGVATAGAAVRTERDTRRSVAAASAGARATMNLLTGLPLGGVVVAATVGVDPTRLYASAAAQGCLLLGGCLLFLGRWWVARLTRAAVRPEEAT